MLRENLTYMGLVLKVSIRYKHMFQNQETRAMA
jgi:hypothetical protein